MHLCRLGIAVVLLSAFPLQVAADVRYSIVDLGRMQPTSINSHGMVAGSLVISGDYHAVTYDGVVHDLGVPTGYSRSFGERINDLGQVAVQATPIGDLNGGSAFLYGGSYHLILAGVPVGTNYAVFPNGINNSGHMVGISLSNGPWFYDGSIHYLPSLQFVGGINNLDHYTGAGPSRVGGVWYDGTLHSIRNAAGQIVNGAGESINDLDQIAGSYNDSIGLAHGFVYKNGVFQDVGTPGVPIGRSDLFSINTGGTAVGRAWVVFPDQTSEEHAMLFDTALHDLNNWIDPASAWTLNEADAINNSGEIVGFGTLNGHLNEGYLLIPVPEPGIALLVAGLAPLALARGRSKRWATNGPPCVGRSGTPPRPLQRKQAIRSGCT